MKPKEMRKLLARVGRSDIERLVKIAHPKARPYLSNIGELRDVLASAAPYDIALMREIEKAAHAPQA